MSPAPLHVAVVSDLELVRAGLLHLLTSDPDRVRVRDLSADEQDVAAPPVVVLYDLAGLVHTTEQELRTHLTGPPPVIALQPHQRRDLGLRALAAGAAAVVPMEVTSRRLLATVERVATGWVMTSDDLREELFARLRSQHGFSDRELDILELIAGGFDNRSIAEALYLSVNSVKTYIRNAYRKMDVGSRSQAVLWCLDHGLGRRTRPDVEAG